MKRFLTILLVIAAILALTSCDQKVATAAPDANTQSAAPADGGKSDAGAQNGENADPTGGEQSGENIAPVPSTMTQKHIRTTEIENFGYWLYTPSDPVPDMPLIVYLHGGSGKGSDLDLLTGADGFPQYLQEGRLGNVRAYVVMPQLPDTFRGWTNAKQPLMTLIRSIKSNYGINENKISLTGHSMGGTGAWGIALEYPATFSRVAPMSGSVQNNETNLNKLSAVPVWAFVGSADTIVSPDTSVNFINALRERNAAARITMFEGATHFDVPSLAYLDQTIDIVGWLIG